MLDHFRSDVVQALRELRTRPLILVAVVLTLGAAIGMNLAMFGLVDRALLSPPRHLVQPDRLFSLAFRAPGEPDGWSGMTTTSYVTYRTIRDSVPAFSGAAAWQKGPASVVIDGEQVPADTLLVSGNYFDVLGSRPGLGHGIGAADEDAQTASAVLSYTFWKSAYAGDAGVLGRRVTVQGVECTITGVMPRGFSGHSAASVDVWVPITAAMRATPGWDQEPMRNIVSVVARLADGVTVAAAVTQTSAALQRDVALSGLAGAGIGTSTRRVAFWLSGLSLLVVLIGLANSATLLLVRAARRRRDASIRVALGASRGRLVSVAVVEALVIAVAATGASLVMGYRLDEAVRRVLLPGVSESGGLQIRPLVAGGVAGLVTFVVAASAGAWSLPSAVRTSDLKDQNGTGRLRLQKGLLVVQTGVCVVLLAGAGMFGRSLYRLMQQDFGMTLDDVLLVDFESGANPVAGQDQILTDAVERIRALPGVRSATAYQSLPFGGHHIPPISVPGRAEPPNVDGQLPFLIAATPELFEILGIEVVEGRRFAANDPRDQMVVIVNETMARVTWPGERAVGKCIRAGFDPAWDPYTATGPPTASASLPCREVIGVARDVRQRQVVPSDNEARLMQYLRAVLSGPRAAGWNRAWLDDERAPGACGAQPLQPDRIDSPARHRRSRQPSAVRSGSPVCRAAGTAGRAVAPRRRTSGDVQRACARRGRGGSVCGVRACGDAAPEGDGDSCGDRRNAVGRAADDPSRGRGRCRDRHRRGNDRRVRRRPLAPVHALRHRPGRPARSRRVGAGDAAGGCGSDARSSETRLSSGSELTAARRLRRPA